VLLSFLLDQAAKNKSKVAKRRNRNTTFYYAMIKQKRYMSKILSLNDQGKLLIETTAIGEHVVHHF